MVSDCLPVGSELRIDVAALEELIHVIRESGYEVIGPVLQDGAISYGPIEQLEDLPCGWTADQRPGFYRLKHRSDAALFGYASGPKSMKDFLHVSQIRTFNAEKPAEGPFRILPDTDATPRYAFLGVRGCEIAAMFIQDRVLLGGRERDGCYEERRKDCLIIAVHCNEPSEVCFCDSMDTGPRAKNFDLALTEFVDAHIHEFLVQIGSETGAEILSRVPTGIASAEMKARSHALGEHARQTMSRALDRDTVADLLKENFNSPHWDLVAERCLACGNCTMVCPTCFCVTFEDSSDITGQHAERWRKWDSCYSLGFSYIHGGSVRSSTKSRYRQWLTHKLSSWVDQFGSSGCVGCGRCITWCPVGIDLTEEVKSIAAAAKKEEL